MNAEATVLKLYPLGENGLIAVWCTEEGLIRTAAKSARKPGSPFAGCLDIFYQCRMQWTQAKKGDLHTLTSADLLSPRLALRKSYLRLSGDWPPRPPGARHSEIPLRQASPAAGKTARKPGTKRKLSNMPILLSSSAGDVPRPAQHVLPPGRDAHCSVREIDLSAAFGQNIRHGFTA